MATASRAIGLCGLFLILFYARGAVVPFVILAALFGALLKR
jgi:cytochrome c biogenesis protein CcdA